MSNFSKMFAQEFAERCKSLLDLCYRSAAENDLEVTLLLTVASAGFVVPYERIKPPQKDDKARKQPLLDRESNEQASSQLYYALECEIQKSELIDNSPGVWMGGPLETAKGDPDNWPQLDDEKEIPPTETVKHIVECLRNALAHGNITTRKSERVIDRVFFICGYEDKKGPRYVSVTPDNLREFLNRWFDFVRKLNVPLDAIAEGLGRSEGD
jgi:hypothetical protein